MLTPIAELKPGDVVSAFVWPDGTLRSVRGGPLEVASIAPTGGQCDGHPQIEIIAAARNRSARYSNGATLAIVDDAPGASSDG